jgi:PASTA domain
MSLDRARKELQGLSLGASAPRTAPGSARVVDQRPAEGSTLSAGSVVTLQVDLPQEAGNAPPKDTASTGWCCVLQSGYGAQQQQQQQVQRTGGGEVIEMDEKQCAGAGGTFWQQQSQAIAACRPPGAPAAPAAPGNLRVQ